MMATFDERAATWDTPRRIERANEVAKAIRAALPLGRGIRAIEIGAGTGLLGLSLADDVDELVLTDPAAGMLEVADEKIRQLGRSNVRTQRYDLVADPVPAGAPFDVALSLLMLHHLEDTATALASVRGLLRSGGLIGLADLDKEDGTFHSADAEGIHHQGFDRDALGTLARDAGFGDIDFTTATVTDEDDAGRGYPIFLMTGRAI